VHNGEFGRDDDEALLMKEVCEVGRDGCCGDVCCCDWWGSGRRRWDELGCLGRGVRCKSTIDVALLRSVLDVEVGDGDLWEI
jgi:hypothetical protein